MNRGFIPMLLSALLTACGSSPEVCFGPDEPCEEKLLSFLRTAEKSIDMAAYQFSLPSVADEIIKQSKRVRVRIVADRDKSRKRKSLIPKLKAQGIDVRFGRQEHHQHNKFVIVDGKTVETGSFNYSVNASRRNQENQVYLRAPRIVERFRTRFEKMWGEAER